MGAYNYKDTAADIIAFMILWLTSLTRLSIFRVLHDKLKSFRASWAELNSTYSNSNKSPLVLTADPF